MALILRSAVVGDIGMPLYQGRTTPPCKYNIARAPTQSGVMGTDSLPSSLAETCRLPLLRRVRQNGNALQSLLERDLTRSWQPAIDRSVNNALCHGKEIQWNMSQAEDEAQSDGEKTRPHRG